MLPAESIASQLEAHADFRVLRRVPPVERWNLAPANDVVRGVVVDCETTGLGGDDEVIELATIPFDYCRESGDVAAVHKPFAAFCEPQKAISEEAARVHGITQEMVAGHVITDADVAAAVGGAKIAIAHNAWFDRRMTGKTWPLLDTLCWGCSYKDVDWRAKGFDSAGLSSLLMASGWFYDGHRALDDALATLFLLTLGHLPALLETARQPLYKVTLRNTPYSAKDSIKARGGYQWDDNPERGKSWWKCANEKDVADESIWANSIGLKPDIKRLPFGARHSHRLVEL